MTIPGSRSVGDTGHVTDHNNIAGELTSLTTQVAAANAAAIPKTLVDAKGDVVVASAADTPARLAVGTNGQVLTANSA